MSLSRSEARRTDLDEWPRFHLPTGDRDSTTNLVAFFSLDENAVTWLHYLARALPFAAVLVAWRATPEQRRPTASRAIVAIGGMTLFSVPWLVRGNVATRLGDVGPLLAVSVAVVCHALARSAMERTGGDRVFRLVLLVVLLTGTALSVGTVGGVWQQLGTAGLTTSPDHVRLRTLMVSRELAALPDEYLTQPVDSESLRVSQYLHQCTAPSDRVVGMTYAPELMPIAGRLFGGGRLSIIPGYALDDRQQRVVMQRWEQQSVPLALVEFEDFYDPSSTEASILRDYLLAHYDEAGEMSLGTDRSLRVFVRRGVPVVSTRDDGLPCLR